MSKKVVLALIDDEPDIGQLYASILKPLIREDVCDLHFFTSGHDFLKFLESKESRVDIILSDLNMPEMNGFTLLEKVKEKHSDEIDLYISSAYDSDDYKERAKALGVIDFLVKPIEFDDVTNIISNKFNAQ